jgi:hypothetical protein
LSATTAIGLLEFSVPSFTKCKSRGGFGIVAKLEVA